MHWIDMIAYLVIILNFKRKILYVKKKLGAVIPVQTNTVNFYKRLQIGNPVAFSQGAGMILKALALIASLILVACQPSSSLRDARTTGGTNSVVQTKAKNEGLSEAEARKTWCFVLGYKEGTKEMNDCMRDDLDAHPIKKDKPAYPAIENSASYSSGHVVPVKSVGSVKKRSFQSKQATYYIQVSHNDDFFVINDEKFEAKTYCFDMEDGDQIIFIDGSPYGACVSAELLNLRTKDICEVWCE